MQLLRALMMVVFAVCAGCDDLDEHSLGALEEDAGAGPAQDAPYVLPPWPPPPRRRREPRTYDAGPYDGGPRNDRPDDGAIAMPCCTAWADFWDAAIDRCDELACQRDGPPPPRQGP